MYPNVFSVAACLNKGIFLNHVTPCPSWWCTLASPYRGRCRNEISSRRWFEMFSVLWPKLDIYLVKISWSTFFLLSDKFAYDIFTTINHDRKSWRKDGGSVSVVWGSLRMVAKASRESLCRTDAASFNLFFPDSGTSNVICTACPLPFWNIWRTQKFSSDVSLQIGH